MSLAMDAEEVVFVELLEPLVHLELAFLKSKVRTFTTWQMTNTPYSNYCLVRCIICNQLLKGNFMRKIT